MKWKHISIYNYRQAVNALIFDFDQKGEHRLPKRLGKSKSLLDGTDDKDTVAYIGNLFDFILTVSEFGSFKQAKHSMRKYPRAYNVDGVAQQPFYLVPFEDTKKKVHLGLHVSTNAPYNHEAVSQYQKA